MNAATTLLPPAQASKEALSRGRAMLLLFDLEGYSQAVPLLREAIEADPGNALAHGAIAETYAYWGFRRELNGQEAQSYYELAFESAVTALRLGPETGEAHRAMAVALRKGDRCDPAQRQSEAKTALDINPYNGENCHECWKAHGSALSDQNIYKAIALYPSLISAHIDLGAALSDRGRMNEAAYHFARALEVNPRNSLAHYDLAMLHLRQGDFRQAQGLLARALDLYPKDGLLLSGVAHLSRELKARAR